MGLPKINSIKIIEQQYRTGEEPVLVMCSDMNADVCKYMRSSAASYKLVCELIGVEMMLRQQSQTRKDYIRTMFIVAPRKSLNTSPSRT